MPQIRRRTYREQLFELAQEQHGYVSTNDARRLGIPTVELRKLAHRGKIENIYRGIYQFPQLSGSKNENYLLAILSVAENAYLTGYSVLAFHDLAQVNPRKIRVGTNQRVRREIPDQIHVTTDYLQDSDIEVWDGVRSTRVARAIIDSKGIVMTDRLLGALTKAIELGLVTGSEETQVRTALAS